MLFYPRLILRLLRQILLCYYYGILLSFISKKQTGIFWSIVRLFLSLPIYIFHRNKSEGECLLYGISRMGSVFVKFGQMLSTRRDIVGDTICKNLEDLQDNMPSFSITHVKDSFYKTFGVKISEIFKHFEEQPIAAASMSQVHKAVLQDGKLVAVKVLRPKIKNVVSLDTGILLVFAYILSIFSEMRRISIISVVKHFKQVIVQETNLQNEAVSMSQFSNYFKQYRDVVYVPEVIWSYTSADFVTMDWVDGIKIKNKLELLQNNINLKELASKLIKIAFVQSYCFGFLHADLHPGNIFVMYDGRICFVDFGVVSYLPECDRIAVTRIIKSFIDRDFYKAAKIHKDVGYVPSDTDVHQFSLACRSIIEPVLLKSAKDVSISDMLTRFFIVSREFGMETQIQLILLQKTMLFVEGISRDLDPEVNIWQVMKPLLDKWKYDNFSLEANLKKFILSLPELSENITMITKQIKHLSQKYYRDQLTPEKKHILLSNKAKILYSACIGMLFSYYFF